MDECRDKFSLRVTGLTLSQQISLQTPNFRRIWRLYAKLIILERLPHLERKCNSLTLIIYAASIPYLKSQGTYMVKATFITFNWLSRSNVIYSWWRMEFEFLYSQIYINITPYVNYFWEEWISCLCWNTKITQVVPFPVYGYLHCPHSSYKDKLCQQFQFQLQNNFFPMFRLKQEPWLWPHQKPYEPVLTIKFVDFSQL